MDFSPKMDTPKSDRLFKRAQRWIPGGVNSPVRAFKSVGHDPLFIAKAQGSKIWDADGNVYIDYVCSWGPLILGHAYPSIVEAVKKATTRGTSYGAPTEIEVKLAEIICKLMPSVEMVRMVNSGTEATMSAVRLARAYTGRNKIIKFEGCYHGHADGFLIKAGSGATTLGIPDSPGIPEGIAKETLTAKFNCIESVEQLILRFGSQIAAVIVEPVAGNMGVVPPKKNFLQDLRRICTKEKILLIFDEVITGFRLALGGALEYYGIKADLATLGKIIGGGLPVGAYGGKREIMEMIAPKGPVYQAGTLSGNPIAMAAGYVTLKILLRDKNVYKKLETKSAQLAEGIQDNIMNLGVPVKFQRVGSMFTLFFTEKEVIDYNAAKSSDTKKFAAYFHEMLRQGIYLPPSQFEAAFLSTAHTAVEIEKTIAATRRALRKIFS